eukprot:3664422-Pyramimonas_sp.AAC.1
MSVETAEGGRSSHPRGACHLGQVPAFRLGVAQRRPKRSGLQTRLQVDAPEGIRRQGCQDHRGPNGAAGLPRQGRRSPGDVRWDSEAS